MFGAAVLNARANRLANRLIARGIGPEDVVGVAFPRSLSMIEALLGVLKAGAAYLPIDPAYPRSRVSLMLADARPAVIVTTRDVAATLPAAAETILCLDDDPPVPLLPQAAARVRPLHALHPAYLTYTSGSTGAPKGVVLTHAGLANLAVAQIERFAVTSASRVLHYSAVGFDGAVSEWVTTLPCGACLVLPRDEARIGDGLAGVLTREAITHVTLLPTVLATLGEARPPLETLVVAAETCSAEAVARWSPHVRMINAYGPTEVTVCATMTGPLRGASAPDIGTPMWNMRVYVLDANLEPSPIGVNGELYVAGMGLGRAYVNRPARTGERFVADPYGPAGTRMYRTGDRVRWRPDGTLEFLGRVDHQVKIRGFRIEFAEIEAALAACPGVAHAVAAVREDGAGERRLVGYVVAENGVSLDPSLVRKRLSDELPAYLLPSAIVVLEALPLTPHGKVDRQALPAPAVLSEDVPARPYPVEELLCDLHAEVLGVDRVGLDDRFFDLGGHSLLAMRLVNRIGQALATKVSLRDFFEATTVAELARHIERASPYARAALEPQPRPVPLPTSYAQRRLWLLDRLAGASTEYNTAQALTIRGDLNVDALERAFTALVERHETLRTRFADVGGEPVQIVDAPAPISISVEDLSGFDRGAADERARAAVSTAITTPFDLAAAPPLRVRLLRTGEQEHVLVWVLHHIASDGWSLAIVYRELAALYQSCVTGNELALPALRVQYADFTLWQRASFEQAGVTEGVTYWRSQLAGIPARLELPADRPRPAVPTFDAGINRMILDADRTAALKRFTRTHGATPYMTLLTALAVLLWRYSGQRDFVVGTPVANRPDPQLEGLIGCFVNMLPMRMRVQRGMSLRDLLAEARRTALEAYQHQDVPFEQIVGELAPERSLNAAPIVQVVFAMQNAAAEAPRLSGLSIEPFGGGPARVRFELEVQAWEHRDRIGLTWVYSRDLLDEPRVERMMRHYAAVLDALVAAPAQTVEEVTLLGEAEQSELLVTWNETAQSVPATTVTALFEAQAARTPDAVALVDIAASEAPSIAGASIAGASIRRVRLARPVTSPTRR